ncbi:MAG: MBOAT family O-acyltransferase [Butyricicoccus sp.]
MIPARSREARNNALLLFSLLFYAWGEPVFVGVMLLSIAVNYLCGLAAVRRPKLACTGAAVAGIGLLVYYKYTGLLLSAANSLFGLEIPVPEIVLPIGISFFTFQGLSYVIDVARGDAPVQKNPLHVALYVALFPQLIAGPIVRYQTVAQEISCRYESLDQAAAGARRFMLGLGKKMLLSNAMGQIADRAFGLGASALTWDIAWLGALAYTMQIYFDFSGYSDMAIGLGRILGFHFLENFNYPYISKSVTEFWRRWHISLSTWFRDYVYIPLGGNRCSKPRWILNILTVWLLTGIWHGAAWNFLLWGLYFGVLLLFEKLLFGRLLDKLPAAACWAYAFVLVMLGWVLFRADSLAQVVWYLKAMFTPSAGLHRLTRYCLHQYGFELAAACIACLPIGRWLGDRERMRGGLLTLGAHAWAFAVFGLSVVWLISSSFNPFIYFRF